MPLRLIFSKVVPMVISGVLTLVLVALVAVQTPWFRDWARREAERAGTGALQGRLSIGKLSGNLLTGANLDDVSIRTPNGEVVSADRVEVGYSLTDFFGGNIALNDVRLIRPHVHLVQTEDGWNVAHLTRPRGNTGPSRTRVSIDDLEIDDGRVDIEPLRKTQGGVRIPSALRALNGDLSFAYAEGRLSLSADALSFQAERPALAVRSLTGGIRRTDEGWRFEDLAIETADSRIHVDGRYDPSASPAQVDLTFETDPVHFAELSGLVPGLGRYHLTPSIQADLKGPLDQLNSDVRVTDPNAGSVRATLLLDLDGPEQAVRGSVTTKAFDAAPILGADRWKTSVASTIDVDLHTRDGWTLDALAGTVKATGDDIDALGYHADHMTVSGRLAGAWLDANASVDAYGATATADATAALDANPVSYRASGGLASLDLRRLPARLGAPRLASQIDGRYELQGAGSRVSGSLTFGKSTVEGATIGSGAAARFALGGEQPTYAFQGDVADLDLPRIGRAMDLQALNDPRLAGDLTGHITVDGSGASAKALRLDASGQLQDSTIAGARVPALAFDATLDGRHLQLSANGRVERLDLQQAAGGGRVTGMVTAAFDVSGTIDPVGGPIGPDAIAAKGQITLADSEVNGIAIDQAEVSGSYANRLADVATFTVKGPNVDVTASGPLSLADGHASALKYTADIAHLDAFSDLAGHDLAGTAHVEGTITGDRSRLVTSGPLRLTRFAYDTVIDALTAQVQYTVAVPDLDLSKASVQGTLDSTLLTLEGRELTSATITARYAQPDLTFDATLRDGRRTARASGRAVLRTGRQELHLERLSLGTQDVTWSNREGQTIDVEYGGNLMTLDHVTLAAGAQRISATGTLALGTGAVGSLDVRVEQVNLAQITNLLLLDRTLGGTLDATATVTGGPDTRKIDGDVTVQNGAIDEFTYQSLKASVAYTPPRAQVDATLVQQPGATLTITGGVPVRGNGRLDLHVTSTPIALAVVRAATTAIENVTGTLTLNADVTGTLDAPLVNGDLRVENGAFAVAPTGVSYNDLQAQIHFAGDSATVRTLHILDRDGSAMTVTGSFGVQGRQIRDITVNAQGEHFHLLDNQLGDVSVDPALTLDGTLGSPRLTGRLRFDTSRLDVAAVLERFTSNPYSTTPESRQAQAPAQAGPYANLAMDLTIAVPDDLVLRGNDIHAGGGPSLGNVNTTVGGTFRLQKDPGGDLRVLGTVNTVRGTYEFQGRQFTLVRDGTISFRGGATIDPGLDLTAEREVSGVTVRVAIGGTAQDPKLTLSSDPPMSDTDILSLIIFNQPANQLGEGQRASLGDRAAALASGAVIGALSQSLEQALNLTVFEVQTVSEAGGAPMVTIGKQVNEKLFVRLQQLFGAQQVSRLMLDYELNSVLRLQGEVSDGNTIANRSLTRRIERGGADLVLTLRY